MENNNQINQTSQSPERNDVTESDLTKFILKVLNDAQLTGKVMRLEQENALLKSVLESKKKKINELEKELVKEKSYSQYYHDLEMDRINSETKEVLKNGLV